MDEISMDKKDLKSVLNESYRQGYFKGQRIGFKRGRSLLDHGLVAFGFISGVFLGFIVAYTTANVMMNTLCR